MSTMTEREMNNELIERIDEELERIRAEEDAFESLEGSVMHIARDIERRKSLWNDCKAALIQQQEAEPVVDWANFPAYLIDHYEGKIIYEETLQEALSDMLRDPKYHPPKPAAQPVDDEAMFEWIYAKAAKSLRRHNSSTRGQQITREDGADAHLIRAALEWAELHPREVSIKGVTLDGCMETLFRIGEHLGIDYAEARKSPLAPSGVYINAIEARQAAQPQVPEELKCAVEIAIDVLGKHGDGFVCAGAVTVLQEWLSVGTNEAQQ